MIMTNYSMTTYVLNNLGLSEGSLESFIIMQYVNAIYHSSRRREVYFTLSNKIGKRYLLIYNSHWLTFLENKC